MKMAAHPFGQLLGLQMSRIPASTSATVVVCGKRVDDVRSIDRALPPQEDDDMAAKAWAEKLRKEVQRARARERYQRQRQNPEQMAKRKAWYEANREKVIAYKKAWDQANRDRMRQQQAAWARKNYHHDLELARAKARANYQANRENILATLQAKRDAAKAAKAAQS